jgi:ECF sigma factor
VIGATGSKRPAGKGRAKHGGGCRAADLRDLAAADRDDALTRLAAEELATAGVVELRQIAGLGHEQVTAALEISVARQRLVDDRA